MEEHSGRAQCTPGADLLNQDLPSRLPVADMVRVHQRPDCLSGAAGAVKRASASTAQAWHEAALNKATPSPPDVGPPGRPAQVVLPVPGGIQNTPSEA